MRIFKDSITRLASLGYVTLQVPDTAFGSPSIEMEDVPDEWLCVLTGAGRHRVGKELGFLYLTKAGWDANKEKIKEKFLKAIETGLDRTESLGWVAFERHVVEHFESLEKRNKKFKTQLEEKLEEMKRIKI